MYKHSTHSITMYVHIIYYVYNIYIILYYIYNLYIYSTLCIFIMLLFLTLICTIKFDTDECPAEMIVLEGHIKHLHIITFSSIDDIE